MPRKLVTVFQQNQPDHLAAVLGLEMPVGNMRKVASFDIDLATREALEDAFRFTNHHGAQWTLRRDVYAEPATHRSTSIGDVVMMEPKSTAVCLVVGLLLSGALRPLISAAEPIAPRNNSPDVPFDQ